MVLVIILRPTLGRLVVSKDIHEELVALKTHILSKNNRTYLLFGLIEVFWVLLPFFFSVLLTAVDECV